MKCPKVFLGGQHPSPNVKPSATSRPKSGQKSSHHEMPKVLVLKAQGRHVMCHMLVFSGRILAGKGHITWWMHLPEIHSKILIGQKFRRPHEDFCTNIENSPWACLGSTPPQPKKAKPIRGAVQTLKWIKIQLVWCGAHLTAPKHSTTSVLGAFLPRSYRTLITSWTLNFRVLCRSLRDTPGSDKDAAILLTAGVFLLTAELLCLQLRPFSLTITFFTHNWSFFTYNWSFVAYSGSFLSKHINRLQAKNSNCKQKSFHHT